jgi:hypothetical protein
MANAEHCSQSPMSCQHASRFAEKLLEAHPKHCLMPDAWRVAAMGREAAPQKGTFREWRCAGDIPKSCLVTDGSRCIGANQARKLGAADPMAASEKARQTNLRIGGLTRLAAPGRSVSSENPRNAVICIHGTGSGEKGHSPACNMMNNLTAVPRTGSGAPVSANR